VKTSSNKTLYKIFAVFITFHAIIKPNMLERLINTIMSIIPIERTCPENISSSNNSPTKITVTCSYINDDIEKLLAVLRMWDMKLTGRKDGRQHILEALDTFHFSHTFVITGNIDYMFNFFGNIQAVQNTTER